MTHRTGELDQGRLFFQVWEAPDARADVVLSHGYAEHSGRYGHVAEQLVAAGLTVWALDHHGHGRSQGEPRGDIRSWAEAVADVDLLVDLVEEQADGRPTFLVGHSMGGAIALAYALEHQDRLAGLSLSAPAIVIPPELLAVAQLDPIPVLPLADGVSSDPGVVQAYKDDELVHQGAPARNLLEVMGSTAAITGRLGEIVLPVQVMQGSSDLLIPVQALREVVAGVSSTDLTARVWPGLFHEIFNEPTKDAVVGELVTWVRGRLG
ncbi:MAG: alpha/beta hydrolase [Nocardioides sp.]